MACMTYCSIFLRGDHQDRSQIGFTTYLCRR
jgi:hypothetical protein